MNIIDVIPLSRGIGRETLSYFTSNKTGPGTIINVPLRGKTINALVVSSRSATESKMDLKNATFAFKKAGPVVTSNLLPIPFIAAAQKTAEYHVSTLGSLLTSAVPKIVLENAKDLSTINIPARETRSLNGFILQADTDERFANYRSFIREEFARGKSVFLLMPTTGDIKRAEKLLEKGIGEYSYIFHNQIKKKDFVTQWNALSKESHPVFIIGTGQFLSVPRADIGTIIVERENSRTYKSISRPYTDLRYLAEMYAKEIGARLILSDALLRTETVWRYRNNELGDIVPPTFRVQTTALQKIVDMRELAEKTLKFEPMSDILIDLIKNTREKSERLFIFASRRGLSPLTVCADCGTVVTCKKCLAPVVLHGKVSVGKDRDENNAGDEVGGVRNENKIDDSRYFHCHRCGKKRDANEKCHRCTSWRLKTLGVGIELFAEEIKKRFPDFPLERLDGDTAKSHAEATRIAKRFYDTPGGILVGTEMALLYLDQKVESVAVASIDSMFSLPDFRIREKIFSILLRLRSLAQKKFLAQTRNIEESVWGLTETGDLTTFYKQELADRQTFDYPPHTVLIKVSLSGEKSGVEQSMIKFAEAFKEYDVSIYPAFIPFSRGTYTMHALIKIGHTRWVEQKLFEKLRSLPPSFSIAVDPENIL